MFPVDRQGQLRLNRPQRVVQADGECVAEAGGRPHEEAGQERGRQDYSRGVQGALQGYECKIGGGRDGTMTIISFHFVCIFMKCVNIDTILN